VFFRISLNNTIFGDFNNNNISSLLRLTYPNSNYVCIYIYVISCVYVCNEYRSDMFTVFKLQIEKRTVVVRAMCACVCVRACQYFNVTVAQVKGTRRVICQDTRNYSNSSRVALLCRRRGRRRRRRRRLHTHHRCPFPLWNSRVFWVRARVPGAWDNTLRVFPAVRLTPPSVHYRRRYYFLSLSRVRWTLYDATLPRTTAYTAHLAPRISIILLLLLLLLLSSHLSTVRVTTKRTVILVLKYVLYAVHTSVI